MCGPLGRRLTPLAVDLPLRVSSERKRRETLLAAWPQFLP
ncbi:hypothetical protein DM2_1251 [Halorubrum sp. DM2]|nr:hypothetical protein DM2_1251 [Halorubrum sp. DM2]